MCFKIAAFIFTTILTLACQRSDSAADKQRCRYGAPEALFAADQPGVAMHRFTGSQTEATEQVTFRSGLQLTLLQSGCDNIRQEFRFQLSGVPQEADHQSFWLEQAVVLLKSLGGLGPRYAALSTWADEIEQRQNEIKLAESFPIQQGFYVRIDRIRSADDATLVLILSDTP